MTLKNLYDELPAATEIAKGNINRAIDHLNELYKEAETHSQKINITKLKNGAIERLKLADLMCDRIQKSIKQLSLNMREEWDIDDK